jgi:PiT family inorganic phosphate transporter
VVRHPSSSSHALIGGIVGAVIAKSGTGPLIASGVGKTVLFIFVSPVLGFLLGALLMVLGGQRLPPRLAAPGRQPVPPHAAGLGRALQPRARRQRCAEDDRHHLDAADRLGLRRGERRHAAGWVIWCCYIAIGLGTMFGGWRIVKTMGQRITKLKPVGGFCAETGGAITLFLATALGIPVSTTHTITGAIVGVGSVRRAATVRWGLAGNIVWAWIFTIPASAFVAAVFYALGVWLIP